MSHLLPCIQFTKSLRTKLSPPARTRRDIILANLHAGPLTDHKIDLTTASMIKFRLVEARPLRGYPTDSHFFINGRTKDGGPSMRSTDGEDRSRIGSSPLSPVRT